MARPLALTIPVLILDSVTASPASRAQTASSPSSGRLGAATLAGLLLSILVVLIVESASARAEWQTERAVHRGRRGQRRPARLAANRGRLRVLAKPADTAPTAAGSRSGPQAP